MYTTANEDYPRGAEAQPAKRDALTSAIDSQELAAEKLQALVDDLINRLEVVLRPAEPSPDVPGLKDVSSGVSPAVDRMQGVVRHMMRIQQTVRGALERLDT